MSSKSFNFSGIGAQSSDPISVNAGEKVRVRLSSVSGYAALSLTITQNGVSDSIAFNVSAGAAIEFPSCAPGDVISIAYEGQTAGDAVVGILESIIEPMAVPLPPGAAQVVHDTMAGHKPEVWISDRYTAQQGHGLRHQTCLAHLDRKARFVAEHGSDLIGMRLQFWFDRAFGFARDIASLAVTTVKQRKRTLTRDLDSILASTTDCPLARELLGQIRRARDQILTFCDFAGKVDATNNISERALRPSVIQRKVTNGYRAKWAADAEAALRTTVDTARLSGRNPFHTILGAVTA
jgi:transposase